MHQWRFLLFFVIAVSWLHSVELREHQELRVANEAKPSLLAFSQEIINYVNNANTTWRAGPTRRFANEEALRKLLCSPRKPHSHSRRLKRLSQINAQTKTTTPYPENFDGRKHWPDCRTIRQVRDQSSCGSCWAFGAVEAMSDRICVHTHGYAQPELSAEDLVSCCNITCGDGCNGGYPVQAWNYWMTNGIVTGGPYNSKFNCRPYEFKPCEHHTNGTRMPCHGDYTTPKCKRSCQPSYSKTYNEDKWYGQTVYHAIGEDSIKEELMTRGSLEADFTVYADFGSYKSGVYQHVAGDLLGGHAVRMIGWGVENGVNYWLMVNSWNEDWGDQGLFKIRRGVNECGIERHVIGGIPRVQI